MNINDSSGSCINLDFPFPKFNIPLEHIYNKYNMKSIEECKKAFLECIVLLRDDINTLILTENSSLIELIPEIEKVNKKLKIKIEQDIRPYLFQKHCFILIDNNDLASQTIKEILSIFKVLPSNIVTCGSFAVYVHYTEYFQGLIKFINSLCHRIGKKFYFYSETFRNGIIGNILYMFCNNMEGHIRADMEHCYTDCTDFCTLPLYVTEHVNSDYFFLIHNNTGVLYRYQFTRFNSACDYYFLFGKEKQQDKKSFIHKPFIVWAYPLAGTGRFTPVFATVLNKLGFRDYFFAYYDISFKSGKEESYKDIWLYNTSGCEDNRDKRVVNLYNMMLANTYVGLHRTMFNMTKIQEQTGADIVILIRDLRDIIVSGVKHRCSLELLRGDDFEKLALNFMKAIGNVTLTRPPLGILTQELVKATTNKNIIFIKFEDLNNNPQKAYIDLFEKLGLTDNPFWVDAYMGDVLNTAIAESQPAPGRGKNGQWVKYFTPKMKEYFKNNSNNFLQIFGYEQDDAW